MKRNKTTLVGLVLTTLILLVALFAPWLVPFDPIRQDLMQGDLPPGPVHVLGTDSYGRDVLSRILMGGRVSLGIALSAVGMALVSAAPWASSRATRAVLSTP